MTFVHSSTQSVVGRTDDGAALQRRLMQDLERQWLNSWTVADQIQAQAAPAPAPEEQPQTNPQDLAKSQPIAQPGNSAGAAGQHTQLPAPAAPIGGPGALSGAAGDRTNATAFAAGGQMTAAGAAENLVAATSGSNQSTGDMKIQGGNVLGSDSGSQLAHPGSNRELPQQVAASAAPVQAVSAALQQSPAAGTIETLVDAIERSIATQAPAAAPAPVGGKSSTMGMTPGIPQAASDSESSETQASSASRRSPKGQLDEANGGSRRLMLRETDDQSVLASVRDTELTSSQSRVAADGLARALMEAGYARVQVVVNGQQHRNERNEAGPKTGFGSSMNDQPQSSNSTTQERLHGR